MGDGKDDGMLRADSSGGDSTDSQEAVIRGPIRSLGEIAIPPLPTLAPETMESIRASQNLSKSMTASLAGVAESYSSVLSQMEASREATRSIAASLANLPVYSSLLKGMLPAISRFTEMVQQIKPSYDFTALYESIRPVALEFQRIRLLERADWPLYLVDDSSICDELFCSSFPRTLVGLCWSMRSGISSG